MGGCAQTFVVNGLMEKQFEIAYLLSVFPSTVYRPLPHGPMRDRSNKHAYVNSGSFEAQLVDHDEYREGSTELT